MRFKIKGEKALWVKYPSKYSKYERERAEIIRNHESFHRVLSERWNEYTSEFRNDQMKGEEKHFLQQIEKLRRKYNFSEDHLNDQLEIYGEQK